MTFALLYSPGPRWLPNTPLSGQPLDDHVEYLTGLNKVGRVLMGGPFADGTGALVVAEVDGLEEALALVAEDPGIRSGVLVASVQEWNRVL